MKDQLIKTITLTPKEYRQLLLLAQFGYQTIKGTPYECIVSDLSLDKINNIKELAYYYEDIPTTSPETVKISVKHTNIEIEQHRKLHEEYLKAAKERMERIDKSLEELIK